MKQLLFIIIAFLSLNINAQKKGAVGKEALGTPYQFKAVAKRYNIFFENVIQVDKDFYAVGITRTYDINMTLVFKKRIPHNSDIKLFKLDEKMNVKNLVTLPVEFFEKDLESIDIKKVGENLCAFYYFNNPKQFKQYLFVQLISLKTLKPIGKMMKIAESPITKKQKNISPIFNIRLSPDEKLILVTNDKTIVARTKKERKAEAVQKNHKLNFWIYNEKMELVNYVKEFSFGKGNTQFLDVAFDNEGNIGFIGFEQKTAEKTKGKKATENNEENANGSSIILKIIKANKEEIFLKIAEKLSFTSAKMVYNKNTNNLAIVGLLYKAGGSDGIFTQQINLKTGELVNENIIKFSKELIKSADKISRNAKRVEPKSERKQRKQDKSDKKRDAQVNKLTYIENLTRLGECYYNDSNELIVMAQQYYWYSVTTTTSDGRGNRTTTTTYYYVYNDIMSFKLNNDAELDNFGIVPHSNVYVNFQVYKDYYALYNNEDVYIFSQYKLGKINYNNKASELKQIKNYEALNQKKTSNEILMYDNTHILIANKAKKKIMFGMVSI